MKKLRVSHYPQIPCKAFEVEVRNLEEAKKIMDVLASYDFFQYKNDIKPDYSNVSILEMLEDGEWIDWEDEETGIQDLEEYFDFISEEDK